MLADTKKPTIPEIMRDLNEGLQKVMKPYSDDAKKKVDEIVEPHRRGAHEKVDETETD